MTRPVHYYSPLNRTFDALFGGATPTAARAVALDVVETPEAYIVKAEVPGVASQSASCPDPSGIKSTDFGVAFGAGLEFRNFTLQGRYDLGLTKLDDAGSDVKNQGWLITLGYAFGGKQ